MISKRFARGAVLLLGAMLICGCGTKVYEPTPPKPPPDRLAKMLEGMIETGDSSPLAYIPGLLERMKEQGDAKADELLADVEQMQAASGQPEKIKELAAKMQAKLSDK